MRQWISDLRWALNMMRAKRFRDRLFFSQREEFDLALRPRIKDRTDRVEIVSYPDAFYHTTIDDLVIAMGIARWVRP